MRSTFMGIEMSKRALFAQQAALTVTGHNVSNANTEGYSRQTINFTASEPLEAPALTRSTVPGMMGQGVEFDQIKRVREKFLDDQYYNENKSLGEWSVRKDTLEKLETIFNEPSDSGIRQVMDGFWNSWQVLSREPENLTARAALKEKSLAMTDAFNDVGKKLQDLKSDLSKNIDVKVGEVNNYTSQIASLNVQIAKVEGLGNQANDLRDQRDLLVDKISKIVNVSVTETNGGYNVNMGGTSLVSTTDGAATITQATLQSAVGADLKSGEVYGMFVSRDQYIPSYEFQLNSMLKSLVQNKIDVTLPKGTVIPDGTVLNGVTYSGSIATRTLTADLKTQVDGFNGLHELGYTSDDPPVSGIPFFTLKNGETEFNANSITVNPEIVAKVSKIVTSGRVYTDSSGNTKTVSGNNDIALNIVGLRTFKFSFDPAANGTPILSKGTFDEFYQAVIGQLGVQSQEAGRQQDNQTGLVEQINSRRQSVSGVSLDEEMANMIKYQQSYNAAARALTVFDQVLDKLINGTAVH
ncbi:flagellar hook-associated protein FlgK [Paenibacillus alginolyticus]|uniref:Flagellar hook-associated protein 1 n=1 Tax=Paenibacillus alginolyticus TaxID=59839 RepID=A0ABT4GIV7_9BACL|nr:flagellar hook-associated protein FlgK [Paenibacillus alginolyticus]MCY9696121.1 flagellar hook-associated protein FlgK [Paenibacillus alginolyticus]MEC0143017.1 flagellar hook-associated protein FlgK [Paenibacillus alginolyticus]